MLLLIEFSFELLMLCFKLAGRRGARPAKAATEKTVFVRKDLLDLFFIRL